MCEDKRAPIRRLRPDWGFSLMCPSSVVFLWYPPLYLAAVSNASTTDCVKCSSRAAKREHSTQSDNIVGAERDRKAPTGDHRRIRVLMNSNAHTILLQVPQKPQRVQEIQNLGSCTHPELSAVFMHYATNVFYHHFGKAPLASSRAPMVDRA